MDENSRDKLGDLADAVAEAFDRYRDPGEFKTISLVIDDSSRDHRTLIVHVDGESTLTRGRHRVVSAGSRCSHGARGSPEAVKADAPFLTSVEGASREGRSRQLPERPRLAAGRLPHVYKKTVRV